MELTWDAAPGASFYRVSKHTTLEPMAKSAAFGLRTPHFTAFHPVRGETVSYTVIAVAADGAGEESAPVEVTSAPARRDAH